MTATEALERRIDELCCENEQLRQQVASIIDRSFRTADKMDCLDTENAKLRELVLDIADHVKHGDGFGIDRGWMLDRMRELGVDEC